MENLEVIQAPRGRFDLLGPTVVPSLLSADFARLGEQLSELIDAGARVFQVDVMDGHFVPPLTMGPLVVRALRDLVHRRGGLLDCHLMVERPERHVEAFAEAGADIVTVHVEATPNVHYVLAQVRAAGCLAGLALNPGTRADVVEPLAGLLDVCLCMTVDPGWGGQPYLTSCTEKVRTLRALLPETVALQVDGGITLETIATAAGAGANLHVAGSSIFGAPDPVGAYRALVATLEEAWNAPAARAGR